MIVLFVSDEAHLLDDLAVTVREALNDVADSSYTHPGKRHDSGGETIKGSRQWLKKRLFQTR
ncbi:MAG: hypothetical protein HY881_17230 [Deltaproteobacteria bacterium]|nr:hypothetical protein [Deltaproteobacteria bacterium]